MQTVLKESIIGLRWVIVAHVAAGLLILAVCSFASEKHFFSKAKTLLFGSVISMDRPARIAWCLALSRLLTVLVYACMPGETDLAIGLVIGLETLGILFLTKDLKTWGLQFLAFAAVFAILLLQGLFYRYYNEVEGQRAYQLLYIFLGVFAVLAALQQTLVGHEQLIRGSNPEMAKLLAGKPGKAEKQ